MAKFQGSFNGSDNVQDSLLSEALLTRLGVLDQYSAANDNLKHGWITVVDPTNQRSLLQACDHCGVVKSENSVVKACGGIEGSKLISSADLQTAFRETKIAI